MVVRICNFILERERFVGGLSASYKDKDGFTWDLGGHVLHSHFPYFDKIVKDNLKNQKSHHTRQSFVFYKKRLIPYPFQNHIQYLPAKTFIECLLPLIARRINKNPKNFLEFINCNFGSGISEHFMSPYNQNCNL